MSFCIIIILACSIVFGLIASLCMVVAVSTNFWEISTFHEDKILRVTGISVNESRLSPENKFYKVVTTKIDVNGSTIRNTDYLRSTYGGIWQLCDSISGIYSSYSTETEIYLSW